MASARVSTGIAGLDEILDGGIVEHSNALIRGPPGSGKTIFGLNFLGAGVANDETVLYINLGEPTDYVKSTAEAFDLDAEAIRFRDLAPSEEEFDESNSYSLFAAADIEKPSFIQEIREAVETLEPNRLVLDPITAFRYLTTDQHQFRTLLLGLLDFLRSKETTVLLTSQAAPKQPDDDLQFLTDLVLNMERYGDGRSIMVSKFRGSSFSRGSHSFQICDGSVEVWPRLVPERRSVDYQPTTLSSGVPELDSLLNGGISQGTITFLSGPTGAGKTTTGLQFLKEAASRGNGATLFSFEESEHIILDRSAAINIPIKQLTDKGELEIVEALPDQYAIDEFTSMVRRAVEDDGIEVLMIDGMQGFKTNLRASNADPTNALLRLGRYLRSHGVTTILTNEVHNVTGEFRATEEHNSNLADNIVFLRHIEYRGEIRKVIGVLKMRTSEFERTLRELEITEHGLKVGEPLPNVRGILTGTPEVANSTGMSASNET